MQSPLELLTEGMRVQTDRGEMMAFNLSSVTQAKQVGIHGQKSLKNIASLFGSVVGSGIFSSTCVKKITDIYEF